MRLSQVAFANVADTKSVSSQLHPMPPSMECQQQFKLFFKLKMKRINYCDAAITLQVAHNLAPYLRHLQRSIFQLALRGIGEHADQPY